MASGLDHRYRRQPWQSEQQLNHMIIIAIGLKHGDDDASGGEQFLVKWPMDGYCQMMAIMSQGEEETTRAT